MNPENKKPKDYPDLATLRRLEVSDMVADIARRRQREDFYAGIRRAVKKNGGPKSPRIGLE